MAVQSVLKMGNPQLLEVSEPIAQSEMKNLDALVADMIDTMNSLDGAGLAAPQIGIMKRVVIFGFEFNTRYPQVEPIPFTVLVNPKIEILNDLVEEDWEGCLSVPGMRGLVKRHSQVRYTGLDQYGAKIDRTVSGFHARVVQHECDHLDGILYPMRVEDMRNFGFEQELTRIYDLPPDD